MRRILTALLAGLLLVLGGCSSDKDRNVNSGKDLPRNDSKAE